MDRYFLHGCASRPAGYCFCPAAGSCDCAARRACPQSPGNSSSKPGQTKYSHANDFLIHGTIFTDKALSFPGVELRIRRVGEKKFHWESYTNSRGEFAVRVPQGSNYELVVRAKGFADQTRTVDAKNGMNEENMVFRMQPTAGGKG